MRIADAKSIGWKPSGDVNSDGNETGEDGNCDDAQPKAVLLHAADEGELGCDG